MKIPGVIATGLLIHFLRGRPVKAKVSFRIYFSLSIRIRCPNESPLAPWSRIASPVICRKTLFRVGLLSEMSDILGPFMVIFSIIVGSALLILPSEHYNCHSQ